jgi:myo-inositol-1(or 4)-monophosphatase
MPATTPDIIARALERFELIEQIVPEAEELLRRLQDEDLEIRSKTTASDLVTRADVECERLLLAAIRSKFPEDDILAEESGLSESAAHSADTLCWAIDPVDGTVNYAHGLPLYAISIGLLWKDQPIAGLVSLPALGRRYQAIAGRGATRNGRRIQVSDTERLGDSLVVTGFPYERARMLETLIEGLRQTLSSARGLRRTGSAAIDLCWVAEGALEAHYEFNLNAWDTAAGVVLVREAGGRVTDFSGQEYTPGMFQMAASNGRIHADLLQMLKPIAGLTSKPE